jgi:hypothetical protein
MRGGPEPSKRGTWAIAATALLLLGGLTGVITGGALAAPSDGFRSDTAPGAVSANLSAAIVPAAAHAAFTFKLPSWQALIVAAAGLAVGGICLGAGAFVAEGGGSVAVGCILLALSVSAAVALFFAVTDNTVGLRGPDLYLPAETEASTLLGSLRDQVDQVGGTLSNVGNLTDDLTGLYGYETSAAAGVQLANSSFDLAANLVDSGVASQILAEADGGAVNLAGPIEGLVTSWNNVFGPTGKYGADGYVCRESANASLLLTSEGTYPTPYLQGFYGGPNPDALGTGSWGSDGECLQGVTHDSVNVTTNETNGTGTTTAGVLLPAPNAGTGSYPVYVGSDSSLLFGDWDTELGEYTDSCDLIGNLTFEGPYPSVSTHVVRVTQGDTQSTSLAPGLYNVTEAVVGSLNLTHDSCSLAFESESYWIGTGILPLILGSNTTDDYLLKSTGIAASASGQLFFACQSTGTTDAADAAIHPYSGIVPIVDYGHANANLSNVSLCPASADSFVPDLESELLGAADVGEAYWGTLHDLGVYQVSTIPEDCAIPTPADFLPPDTSLAAIIGFGPHDISNLLLAYLTTLDASYAVSLDDATFCGYHVPPPGNVTLNDPNWALLGDIFTHAGSQSLATPATWFAVGVGMDVLPKDANYSIPANETFEVPAANPAVVYFGPTAPAIGDLNKSNVENATIDLTYGGVIPNLVGNSTLLNGSVYPADTDSRLGAGDALYLTACWHNESGTWKEVATCDLTVDVVSYQQPTGSGACYFQGDCSNVGTGGFPQAQGLNCGWFLATDFATPFQNAKVFGVSIGDFACVIGWLLVAVVFGVVVVVFVAIIRSRGD